MATARPTADPKPKSKRSPNTMPSDLNAFSQAGWATDRIATLKRRRDTAVQKLDDDLKAETEAVMGQLSGEARVMIAAGNAGKGEP